MSHLVASSDVAGSSGTFGSIIQNKKTDVDRSSGLSVKRVTDKQVVNVSKLLSKSGGLSSKVKLKKNVANVGEAVVKPKTKQEGSERDDDPDFVH